MIDSQRRLIVQAEIERTIEGACDAATSSSRIETAPSNGRVSIAAANATPRADLAGSRLVLPGHAEIYLVDREGYRRRIPNHTTYDRLFRSWIGITDDPLLPEIALRPQMTTGTVLVRGDASARIYLLDDGRKRLIANAAVMDRYWFGWAHIFVIDQALFDRVPMGPEWG